MSRDIFISIMGNRQIEYAQLQIFNFINFEVENKILKMWLA